MERKEETADTNPLKQIINEYRSMGVHFLKVTTRKREYLLILNDSYYLTYWDDFEDIVYSIVIRPKEGTGKTPIEYCDMKHRSLNEWYKDVCSAFEVREDKDSYVRPHRRDIQIGYMNEDERVPLKDFLSIIPRTEYRIFGDYIMFLEIGTGLRKVEKSYHPAEKNHSFINLWMHQHEMRRFQYELEHMIRMVTIHASNIMEIVPAVCDARFAFDDGDVKVLKSILIE